MTHRQVLHVTLLAATAVLTAGPASGQLKRISVSASGAEGNLDSGRPSLSLDGSRIVFTSHADNLVPNDTNGGTDVFLYERGAGALSRISVDSSGAEANASSWFAVISADGEYVTYYSKADNLVPGDTNFVGDVFVYALATGATTRVSVDSAGQQGDRASRGSSISGDGRYVAFTSKATNLAPGDTNDCEDVFVHDRLTGATTRVSVGPGGLEGDAETGGQSLSDDGRFVSFASRSDLLVGDDTNGRRDAFVHDRATGTTIRVSVDSQGGEGNGDSGFNTSTGYYFTQLSRDGRYVAFQSAATNLVPGDTNGVSDMFVHDLITRETWRVSVDSFGNEGSGHCEFPAFFAGGRGIAYFSDSDDLTNGDLNQHGDVFLHDMDTGATALHSVTALGAQGDLPSNYPVLSEDGALFAFDSFATNLVAGDTNGALDVFVIERDLSAPEAYCTAKTNSQGCTPAIGSSGNPSQSDKAPCWISATGILSNKPGLLIYGHQPSAKPFQGGHLCIAAPIRRTPVTSSGGHPPPVDCSGELRFDFNQHLQSGADPKLALGAWVYTQFWSRDGQASHGTNLSDALRLLPGP